MSTRISQFDPVLGRFRRRPVVASVVLVAVVALTLRLYRVGYRVAHWDEGRVAFWALRYGETGTYEYHPITHGPFLGIVNGNVFELFGASDVTARLVVVIVGGLLPLSALLLRAYLSDVEIVAVAALLALDPVLLYYSRFMRNDVLVAAFAFVSVAFLFRLYAGRRPRYLYAAAVALALAFTTKENALVYVLCWLGASVLLVDHALFRLGGDRSGVDRARTTVGRWRRAVARDPAGFRGVAGRWGLHAFGAAVCFVAVLVFFYAPRGAVATTDPLVAVTRPTLLPGVVSVSLFEYLPQGYELWGSGHGEDDVAAAAGNMLRTLTLGSGVLFALAIAGFVHERYARADPRPVVLFAAYWGFVSVVGYPFAASVGRPAWLVVHVVVPLSIPAAVAVGTLVRWAREAAAADDDVGVALCAIVLLLATGSMLAIGYDTSYANPQAEGNVMVQFAQPSGEMRETLGLLERAAADNDGLDVLFYGERYYLEDESVADQKPATGPWYDRLPLPWYTAAAGAGVSSEETPDGLEAALAEEPPIIIAEFDHHDEVESRITGYDARTYDLRGPGGEQLIVVYVDEQFLE